MTDDEDERRVQATAAAKDTTDALLQLNFARDLGFKAEEVDWPRAAAAIEAGLSNLDLSYGGYVSLAAAVARCPDDMSRASLEGSLARWRDANWEALAGVVREEAVEAARRTSDQWDRDFARFLSEWPRLRDDRELLEAAIGYAETAGKAINGALTNLRHLTGGNEEAERVLRFVVGNRYVNNDLVARLLHDWAGTSAWGQLHYDLWVSDKGDAAEPREVAPDVAAAAAELRQLPLIVGTKPAEVSLPEMSKASRAAWRRTLAASVATNEALRADVTEALLWYGANREDILVQVTALEINAGNRDAALDRYKGHPAKVVRLRAASALALATGEPDSFDLLGTSAPLAPTVAALGPLRTWLGDVRIERMLEAALHHAALEMEAETRGTAASGEETQVAILFERMRNACRQVNETLTRLAREMDTEERPEFTLQRRIVGKHEEGGKGLYKELACIRSALECRGAGGRES
jgi:hypothetical protein